MTTYVLSVSVVFILWRRQFKKTVQKDKRISRTRYTMYYELKVRAIAYHRVNMLRSGR